MLGVELSRYAEDAIVDCGDVSQLLLLSLPGDKGLPKTVGTKVGPRGEYGMFIGTKEEKNYHEFQIMYRERSISVLKKELELYTHARIRLSVSGSVVSEFSLKKVK